MRADVPLWAPLNMIPDLTAAVSTVDAGRGVDLATNQFPWRPPPAVDDAIRVAVAEPNIYPPLYPGDLAARLSAEYLVDPDQLVIGPGSVVVLQQLLLAVCAPSERVVFAAPCFDEYIYAAFRARARPVPVRGDEQDLDALVESVYRNDARVAIVCNPHNPTSGLIPVGQLEEFLDRVPDTTLVIVDEAYYEFVDHPQAANGLTLGIKGRTGFGARRNVATLRTFSKAFALGGLRVGFGVASPGVASAARRAAPPYTVTLAAQRAAIAALDEVRDLATLWETVRRDRDECRDTLLDLGYRVPRSHTNFLWLGLGAHATTFGRHCANHGLHVRTYPDQGVRVSVNQSQHTDAFLDAATSFSSHATAPSRAASDAPGPHRGTSVKGGEHP